jgi:hypothetical protein
MHGIETSTARRITERQLARLPKKRRVTDV